MNEEELMLVTTVIVPHININATTMGLIGIAKIRLNLEPGNSNPDVAGTGKSRFQSNPEKMGSSVENSSQNVKYATHCRHHTSHQR